jgi:hypothetical protein
MVLNPGHKFILLEGPKEVVIAFGVILVLVLVGVSNITFLIQLLCIVSLDTMI